MLLPAAPKRTVHRGSTLISLLPALALLLSLLPHAALNAAPKPPATSPLAANSPSDTVTLPRFGLDYSATNGTSVGIGQQVGAGFARVWLAWDRMEPVNTTPDNYRWDYDTVFQQVAAAGMKLSIMIQSCPEWACPNGSGPISRAPVTEFAEFAQAVVKHYSAAPFNAHFYELFNEPDAQGRPNSEVNWGLYPDQYADMLKSTVPGMRRIDPRAKILLGGLAYDWFTDDPYPGPFHRDWLQKVLQAGGGPYIDYVPFHHYMSNIHWPTIGDKAAELRGMLTAYGSSAQLYCNETGFSSSSDLATGRWGTNTPEIQARYLAQIYPEAAAGGMPALVWFSVTDSPDGGGPFASFAQNGLTTDAGVPKLAYYAYRTAVQEYGSSAYIRTMTDAELGVTGVEAYLFAGTNPARPVTVLWSPTHDLRTVHLVQANVARMLDVSGNEISGTPDGAGNISYDLGENPVYIEWSHVQRFTDVPLSFFLYDAIEYLAQHGAISGYANGTFKPFNNATRGQLSKIVVLATGLSITTPVQPTFTDVAPTSPFYSVIETAVAHGLISGYDIGGGLREFHPNANVTRGQLSKIVVKAKQWDLVNPATPTFTDVTTSNPFYKEIETAAAHGIISGYDIDGGLREFRWGNNATRGQISKIIYGALTGTAAPSDKGAKPGK